MVGRGLCFGWGGREENFGVGGEEGRAVGGVEAFWEHDDLGARGGGFEDFLSGVEEVVRFVCACGWGELVDLRVLLRVGAQLKLPKWQEERWGKRRQTTRQLHQRNLHWFLQQARHTCDASASSKYITSPYTT